MDLSDRNMDKSIALASLQRKREFRSKANSNAPIEHRLIHDKVFRMAQLSLSGQLRVNGKVPNLPVAILHLSTFLDTWRTELQYAKPQLPEWEPPEPAPVATRSSYETRPAKCSAHIVTHTLKLVSWPMPKAQESCTVNDHSTEVSENTCGTTTYELIADLGGNIVSHGNWTAFGACIGNYTNCAGVVETGSVEPGLRHFIPDPGTDPPAGLNAYFWTLDDWTTSNSQSFSCSDSDPNPSGVVQDIIPNP